MTLLIIGLIISVIVIVLLLFGIRNLLRQNNQLEDLVISEKGRSYSLAQSAYERMRDADLRGSFESDDEVGGAFQDIKQIVQELKNEFSDYDDNEKKKKEV